jgi:hypothetical protein
MNDTGQPKLLFEQTLDERLAFEMEQKGWSGIGFVELPSRARVKVFFYDPVRLAQDLETDLKSGRSCVAEPGMIVIPRVTIEHMERAVRDLYERGYFDSLVPSPSMR